MWTGTACDGAATDGSSSFVVADSSGVEIASSAAPAWRPDTAWRVHAEASLEIGSALGTDAYSLFRVGSVRRLSDGRIAVANRGTHQIRIYDRDGTHLRDLGREGDGPGEFRSLGRMWSTPGDSIVVDDGLGRVTVFGPDGALTRTVRLLPHGARVEVFLREPLASGHLLVESGAPAEAPKPGRFVVRTWVYERRTAEGVHLNDVDSLAGGPQWGRPDGGYQGLPLSVVFPSAAGDGTSLYLGAAMRAEVRRYSPSGQLTRVIRWTAPQREVTDEVIDSYRSWREDLYAEAGMAGHAMRGLEGMEYPATMPSYQRLLVDATGALWVERYAAPWEPPQGWWVFDPDGKWLGTPAFPSDLDIREVGVDYVLGVREDDSGVEYVVLHRLERGE